MTTVTRDQSQTPARRLLRRRNIVFAALGVVALILGFGSWVLSETLKVHNSAPSPQVNYRLQHRQYIESRFGIDSDQATQAWDLLLEAFEQRMAVDMPLWEEMKDLRFSMSWDEAREIDFDYDKIVSDEHAWSDLEFERRGIQQLRETGVFDKLSEFAAISPGLSPTDTNEPLMQLYGSHGGEIRGMTRARVAAARLALVEGRHDDLLPAVRDCLAMGHSVSLQPDTINCLVAMAVNSLALRELKHEVVEGDFDDDTLRTLLALVRKPHLASLTTLVENERYFAYDTLEWYFSEDGYLLLGYHHNEDSLNMAFKQRFNAPTKTQTRAWVDDWIAKTHAEIALPDYQRWQSGYDPDVFENELRNTRFMFVSWMHIKRKGVFTKRAWYDLTVLATEIMIAIELFRNQHGAAPMSLDELVPDFLPQLPVDPLHGGPIGYMPNIHVWPEYVLYTFGRDGQDDGGYVDPRDPTHARDSAIPGVDYLLYEPRPALRIDSTPEDDD